MPKLPPAVRPLVVAALLAYGPAAALASPAPVRWSAPQRIIASVPNVPSAINASGQAVTLRPGSGPGPALQLATARGPVRTQQLQSTVGGYNDPSVAIAGSGALAAVWDTSSTTGASVERLEFATGTFSAPPSAATVIPTGSDQFQNEQVYETSAGAAVVLWDEQNASGTADSVRALVVPAGGSVPAPVTLDGGAQLVGAGVDGQGDVIVIDASPSSFSEHLIAADGTIGPAAHFTSSALGTTGQAELGLLVDGAGDQLFYWSNVGKHPRLSAEWRSAAGVLGPVQQLGGTGAGALEVAPAVALNAAGDAVAVLTPYGRGTLTVRFASRLGSFGVVRTLGAADRYADSPSVSIDGGDRTLVTWVDYPHPGNPAAREVYSEAHGTRFGAPAPLGFGPGVGHLYLGDAPLASAAPDAPRTVVTYVGSERSHNTLSPIGQVAFPLD